MNVAPPSVLFQTPPPGVATHTFDALVATIADTLPANFGPSSVQPEHADTPHPRATSARLRSMRVLSTLSTVRLKADPTKHQSVGSGFSRTSTSQPGHRQAAIDVYHGAGRVRQIATHQRRHDA